MDADSKLHETFTWTACSLLASCCVHEHYMLCTAPVCVWVMFCSGPDKEFCTRIRANQMKRVGLWQSIGEQLGIRGPPPDLADKLRSGYINLLSGCHHTQFDHSIFQLLLS